MVAKKKHAGGRPKEKPGDKVDLGMVARLTEKGHTDEDIGYILGVAWRTIQDWKKDPEFSAHLKKGKELPNHKVVLSLYKRALGYEYEEVVVEEYHVKDAKDNFVVSNRHIKKTKKHVPPDTGAAAFWLKNRLPIEWRDKHEIVGDPSIPMTFKVVYERARTKPKD